MSLFKGLLITTATLLLTACGQPSETAPENKTTAETEEAIEEPTTVRIGVVGEGDGDVWQDIERRLEDDGIKLEIVVFGDYHQPNKALAAGDLELNAFQHTAFLAEYVRDTGDDIVPIGYTGYSPVYLYGKDGIDSIEDIPAGSRIGIPNTVTNAERSLLALEDVGLITLAPDVGFTPTIDDVLEVHNDIELVELDPSQLYRSLGDLDLVTLSSGAVMDAGLDPADALYNDVEAGAEINDTKKNFIAARREDKDSEIFARIVEEYQTEETTAILKKVSASLPIWTENDDPLADFEALLEELNAQE